MNAEAIQAEILYLLDRNVVSLIKKVNSGKEPFDKKSLAALENLRAIDLPQHAFSPLLSIMESESQRNGESRRSGTVDERETLACLEKETFAVAWFFKNASVDTEYLRRFRVSFVEFLACVKESHWDDRATFYSEAISLVEEKVAKTRCRAIEDRLVALVSTAQLHSDDAIVMLFLACLYGNDAARKVIKPSRPDAYNVLCDLHVISRIGLIKAIVRQTVRSTKVHFRTLDEGLEEMLGCIKLADCRIAPSGQLRMKIRYLPRLFPDLAVSDVVAMLARLTGEAGIPGHHLSESGRQQ